MGWKVACAITVKHFIFCKPLWVGDKYEKSSKDAKHFKKGKSYKKRKKLFIINEIMKRLSFQVYQIPFKVHIQYTYDF